MIARPRWKKVLADLFGNPTRSLLVVASIPVGLFALGVIATLYAVISRDMRVSYAAVQPANIYIQTSLFDRDLLDTLEKLDGVQNVEGVRIASLRALNSAGQWKAIDMISYPDLGKMSLNQVRLAAGTWPPGDGEMVVEQHNLADVGAALGEMVTIERPSGKVRKLKLVGVVQDLTLGAFSGGGGFFDSPVEGFVTTETMDLLEQSSPELFSGVYYSPGSRGR
jgi:putative ABC transport system permease protein